MIHLIHKKTFAWAAVSLCLLFVNSANALLTELWRVDLPAGRFTQSAYDVFYRFDAQGNVYGLSAKLDGLVYTFQICKVTSNGSLAWSKEFSDSIYTFSWYADFSVDRQGNSYVMGKTPLKGFPGGSNIPRIFKYSSDGVFLFKKDILPADIIDDPYTPVYDLYPYRADSLGRILALGTRITGGTNKSLGCALAISSDGVIIGQSTYDGGDPASHTFRPGWSNGPRGPDVQGGYIFDYRRQHDDLNDSTPVYSLHLVGYNADGAIRWSSASHAVPLVPGPVDEWQLTNYASSRRGNLYRVNPPTEIRKYSRDFVSQWVKTYPARVYYVTENPYDESVLVNEPGNAEPLACYNADGSPRWRSIKTGLANPSVYFGPEGDFYVKSGTSTDTAVLYRMDRLTGRIVWELPALLGPSNATPRYPIHIDTAGNLTWAGADRVQKFSTQKFLVIRDAKGDSLRSMTFSLIRTRGNRPDKDTALGVFTTDTRGRLRMVPLGLDTFRVQLDFSSILLTTGDTLKITKHISTIPAEKHRPVLGTMLTMHLDNMRIRGDGSVSFTVLDSTASQDVVLDHSELRYNLLVSVEWNAEESYLKGVEKEFRDASNYLYDVTDGHIRFDTIMLFDNDEFQADADMRVLANNLHNPNAWIDGIYCTGSLNCGYPITMPRKWIAEPQYNPDSTYRSHPLSASLSNDYRTIVHEFGHYALGFDDEYKFRDNLGQDLPDSIARCQPRPAGNYGFMDYQYANGGVYASEMSNGNRYSDPACRNTRHYQAHHLSCWDYLESRFEVRRGPDAVWMPILRPHASDSTERITPAGQNYVTGPNNDPTALDYDVGGLLVFPNGTTAPPADRKSLHVRVKDVPPGGVEVTLDCFNSATGTFSSVLQGNTTDSGLIWALGANVLRDRINAEGYTYAVGVLPKQSADATATYRKVWLCAMADLENASSGRIGNAVHISQNGDSLSLDLIKTPSRPLLCQLTKSGSTSTLRLLTTPLTGDPPVALIFPRAGLPVQDTMTATSNGYESEIQANPGSEGILRFQMATGQGQPFFFNASYVFHGDTPPFRIVDRKGGGLFELDSASTGIQNMTLTSTVYPVPMAGLDEKAVQAGATHALTITATSAIKGIHHGEIRYSDDDLFLASGVKGDESSLKIHRWDTAQQVWLPVGGVVDTSVNAVYGVIPGAGIYAAFTTRLLFEPALHGKPAIQPQLRLGQNIPNPFTAMTRISFSLPRRGVATLEIFEPSGRKVRTLVHADLPENTHSVTWDGADDAGRAVPAGHYFYRLKIGKTRLIRKMIFLP